MRVLKVNRNNPEQDVLKRAADMIRQGGIVVSPTDTCYGLAGDVMNPHAISKIYAIKQRPERKPISVIVKDLEMMASVAVVTDVVKTLVEKYLPGPLTIVVPRLPSLAYFAADSTHHTIGIRIPDCKVSLQLVEMVGRPITTTSANISGHPPAYSAQEIMAQFGDATKQPDLFLDAGVLPKVPSSTVVEVLPDGTMRVLREGPITIN